MRSLFALITRKRAAADTVPEPFSPLGRTDKRALAITEQDEHLVTGQLEQLQIMIRMTPPD